MTREIKFRVINGNVICAYEQLTKHGWMCQLLNNSTTYDGIFYDAEFGHSSSLIRNQFTGLLDKNEVEIYEGDIFRIEEDATKLDDEDRIFYVVIVWVQEWCMFCTLEAQEYQEYLINGIKALDEPMFWTYTLEDTNSRKHFLCGNIYETPELLKQ